MSQSDPADRSTWGPTPQPGYQPAPDYQQPGYPAQPGYQPAPTPVPARRRSKWAVLVSVLVFALAAAAAVGIVRTILHKSVPANQAATGQCIQDPEKHQSPVVTDCDSDDAAYRVTAPAGSTCTQVPGTTTTYQNMCLIGTKEDSAQALSSAKVGDCLNIDNGGSATISECTSGTYPILMVLNDVSKMKVSTSTLAGEDACQEAGVDAAAYDGMYVWSFAYFQSSNLSNLDLSNTYDYAFCLGAQNS